MTSTRLICAVGLALGPIALSGCGRSADVSYRITIEVDDNGVSHSGTGVWNVRVAEGGFPNAYSSRFRGDAIAVDIGGRGTLFALIVARNTDGLPGSSDGLKTIPSALFGRISRSYRSEILDPQTPVQVIEEVAGMQGATAILDCSKGISEGPQCPFFVRFRDTNDPPYGGGGQY